MVLTCAVHAAYVCNLPLPHAHIPTLEADSNRMPKPTVSERKKPVRDSSNLSDIMFSLPALAQLT